MCAMVFIYEAGVVKTHVVFRLSVFLVYCVHFKWFVLLQIMIARFYFFDFLGDTRET